MITTYMAKYIKVHNAPLSGGYVNGSRTDVSIGARSAQTRFQTTNELTA